MRQHVLDNLDEVAGLAHSHRIDIHMMAFSFTDAAIAARLSAVAGTGPGVTIRLLADWSQIAAGGLVPALAGLGLRNLLVRYKADQPYEWDHRRQRLRWSYRVSRGLLHHKTLSVYLDGQPWRLICGSFNWTNKAARSYENLLTVTPGCPNGRAIIASMELEFQALWCDGQATLSPTSARAHYEAIERQFRSMPRLRPNEVTGLGGCDNPGRPPDVRCERGWADTTRLARVAFSHRDVWKEESRHGQAPESRSRRFEMQRLCGRVKRVPVSLSTLALDTVFRAQPGDTLLVALYALSRRVPVYGALLDAARRGVRIRIILDGDTVGGLADRMSDISVREHLALEVRTGRRMMHQKYLVHPESATTLTGTANMTTDALRRHSEHMMQIRGDRTLAAAYERDFETMWKRFLTAADSATGPK